jgi:transposase
MSKFRPSGRTEGHSGVDGEIVARVERRRQWTPEDKAALLAEVEAAGGRVSAVARRHGISKSLLYNWRSAWKAALAARGSPAGSTGFLQLGVVAGSSDEDSTLRTAVGATRGQRLARVLAERVGVMEIDLPERVRVRVDSGVDEAALRRVLAAVRGLR